MEHLPQLMTGVLLKHYYTLKLFPFHDTLRYECYFLEINPYITYCIVYSVINWTIEQRFFSILQNVGKKNQGFDIFSIG